MWLALYRRFSLLQLSTRFGGVSVSTIRSAMLRSGLLPLKDNSRTGKKFATRMSLREARQLQKEGIARAARRLQVPYTVLYARLRRTLKEAYQAKLDRQKEQKD